MTPQDVRDRADRIRQMADYPERACLLEAKLYREVLTAIAHDRLDVLQCWEMAQQALRPREIRESK